MIDCLDRKIVKVKKSHQCFGCCRKFEKGSELERAAYADQGTAYSIYTCQTCVDIFDVLARKSRILPDDEFDWGWMWEFQNMDRSYGSPKYTPEEYLEILKNEKSNQPS